MKKKGIVIITICLMMLSMHVVKAESSIIIDGNFSDWDSETITYNQLKDPLGQGAAISDQDYVYLHLAGKYNWTNLGGCNVIFTMSDQTTKTMELQNSAKEFDLIMKDISTYQEISGAVASGSMQNNTRNWELRIPKTWCGDVTTITIDNVSFPVETINKEEVTPPVDGDQPSGETPPVVEPEQPDEVEDNDQSNNDNTDEDVITNGIEIDGYYKDWDSMTHTPLEWDNNVIANACAVKVDDQICVHVGTTYYRDDRHLNLSNIIISINGKQYSDLPIKLREIDKNGNISNDPLENIKQNKKYQMVAVINNAGVNHILGDAFYTTKMAHDREDFEFCMSISALEKALNVTLDTKDQIQISFPSIGNGSIIIEGTSSGPWLLAGLGIVIALGGFYMTKKKQCNK